MVSLLSFLLGGLFIDTHMVLKSPILLYWRLYIPLWPLIFFKCPGFLQLEKIYMYSSYILLLNWSLKHYLMHFFFECCNNFCVKVYSFSDIKIIIPACFYSVCTWCICLVIRHPFIASLMTCVRLVLASEGLVPSFSIRSIFNWIFFLLYQEIFCLIFFHDPNYLSVSLYSDMNYKAGWVVTNPFHFYLLWKALDSPVKKLF